MVCTRMDWMVVGWICMATKRRGMVVVLHGGRIAWWSYCMVYCDEAISTQSYAPAHATPCSPPRGVTGSIHTFEKYPTKWAPNSSHSISQSQPIQDNGT